MTGTPICIDARETNNVISIEMLGKAADGEAFDITAQNVTIAAIPLISMNAVLFLGSTQYGDPVGATDPQLTVIPKQAVFSGAKLSSASGSNITLTGTLACP